MIQPSHTGDVQQNEGNLKWTPAAVFRLIHVLIEIDLFTATDTFGENGMRPLHPHRSIHEQKRFTGFRILRQQFQPFFDALQRLATVGDRHLTRISELSQSLSRILQSRFFTADPVAIGHHQRFQLPVQLFRIRLGQYLHIQHQPLQPPERRIFVCVFFGGWCSARYLVRRDHGGFEGNCVAGGGVRVVGGEWRVTGARGRVTSDFSMNSDTMADGELDLMPVQHGCQSFFRVILIADGGAAAENGLTIFAGNLQLWLKQVTFVFGAAFLLVVDQKQSHNVVGVSFADLPLNLDILEVRHR